jgi:hypothetical protein
MAFTDFVKKKITVACGIGDRMMLNNKQLEL